MASPRLDLTPAVADKLATVVRRIVAVAHPERIILFGSAARGTAGPDSDLDLLVVKSGVDTPAPPAPVPDALQAQLDRLACHKAAGKPFLRPALPTAPPAPILNFGPGATWPQ